MCLDHIDPVVPVTGWVSFDDFIDRLYCEVNNFQVLCADCHADKTFLETGKRTKKRNKSKKKGK